MGDISSDSDCGSGGDDAVSLRDGEKNYDEDEGSDDTNEEKVKVRVDPCLVCGHPAVFYNPGGTIINREITSQCNKFSFNHLLSSLCHGLGLRKNSKQLRAWNFDNDPFPFCDDCHLIIDNLAQLQTKVEQLQETIKVRLITAEEKYLMEDLYSKHDQRYFSFRREVIPAPTAKKSSTSRSSRTEIPQCSKKQEKLMTPEKIIVEEEFATPRIWCDNFDEVDNDLVEDQILNSTTASSRPADNDNQSTEPVPSEIPSTSRGRPTQRVQKTGDTLEKAHSSSPESSLIPIQSKVKFKRRKLHAGSLIFRKKAKHEAEKVAQSKYQSINTITDTEITRTIKSSRGMGMGNITTQDLETGNFTYETGFGNRFGTTRVSLKFEVVEGDDTILKCASCSETVQRLPHHKILTTEFRKHLFKFHSAVSLKERRKCITKVELHNRLKLESKLEKVTTIENTEYRHKMGYRTSEAESLVSDCEICGMPVADIPNGDYISHRQTHMNSQDMLDTKGQGKNKYYGLLPANLCVNGGAGRLCETCGKILYGGKNSMAIHLQTHLPEEERPSCLCPICGAKLSTKNTLESHLKRVHKEGKWEGWNVCQYPDCKQSFDTKDNLVGHVAGLHSKSEQACQNLMCFRCGKAFTTSWSLKIHGTVHSKDNQHECALCSKTFTQKATLLMHLAAVHRQGEHYGVFECEVDECSEVFPCDKYRKHHMRKKHGRFLKRKTGEVASECK